MKDSAKIVITAGAVFAALSSLSWGAWQFGDYTEIRPIIKREFKVALTQTEQNTQALLWIKFQILDDKFKKGGLSLDEMKERCDIAKILNYPSTFVPGC